MSLVTSASAWINEDNGLKKRTPQCAELFVNH